MCSHLFIFILLFDQGGERIECAVHAGVLNGGWGGEPHTDGAHAAQVPSRFLFFNTHSCFCFCSCIYLKVYICRGREKDDSPLSAVLLGDEGPFSTPHRPTSDRQSPTKTIFPDFLFFHKIIPTKKKSTENDKNAWLKRPLCVPLGW